jgi:hypothetical protein
MNWTEIAMAALGGGIGGALGALLGALLLKGSKNAAQGVTLVLALIGGRGGAELGKSQGFLDMVHPPTRMEKALRGPGKVIESDPALMARFAGLDSDRARDMGQNLAHQGLKRLPNADLIRWNEIRVLLSQADADVCAALWTGKMTPAGLGVALEKLPDADLNDWVQLSTKAMQLEAAGAALPKANAEALSEGLAQIIAKLPDVDRARYQRSIGKGTDLPDSEACWTMLTTMKTAQLLPPSDRESLLRSLAAL